MKKSKVIKKSIFATVGVLFVSGVIFAGTKAPEVIQMDTKGYEKHTKSIVAFTHKKHTQEYKLNCGECHHDNANKPLSNLKEGDNVQKCIECHKTPGEKPKGKNAPKLDKKSTLAFHAEAVHTNCKDCHKEYNKKNNTKSAPTTCKQCHVKS